MNDRMHAARAIAVKVIQSDISEVENWSRLQGLLAMLALPMVRTETGAFRRVKVEVEIAKDEWAAVESLSIDDKGMTFSWGRNGSAVEYRFPGETCPRWRTA